MKKLKILTILFSLLLSLFVFPPQKARAGTVFKLPSSLGLNTNLVGWWTFDAPDMNWQTNKTYDKSGTGNDGAITNMSTSTSPVMGKLGQAMKFNGINQEVDTGTTAAIDNQSQLTFSMWFKRNSVESAIAIEKAGVRGLNITKQSTYNEIYFNINGAYCAIDNLTPVTAWHHIVGVFDGTKAVPADRLVIYADGNLMTWKECSGTPPTTTGTGAGTFHIGRSPTYSGYSEGLIDDVRVYTRALSAGEVTRLYSMGAGLKVGAKTVDSLATGLVGKWTFDAPDMNWQTNKAYDKSGNNNAGSITNMSTSTAPVMGKLGQALQFNGSGNTVTVPYKASLDPTLTGELTLAAWIKPQSLSGYKDLITKTDGVWDSNHYNYAIETNGTEVYFGSGQISDHNSSGANLQTGQWYYVVATYSDSANRVKIYVNGIEKCSDVENNSLANNAYDVHIGTGWTGENYSGSIDDARIYNRALAPSEVTRLYNMGGGLKTAASQASKLTSGLVGYWTFDQPDMYGNTVYDKSGSSPANNGTNNGATKTIGKLGQALKFNGSSDYIDTSNGNSVKGLSQATISAWVKMGGGGVNQNIYTEPINANGSDRFRLSLGAANKVNLVADAPDSGTGGVHVVDSTSALTVGVWYHIVAVFNSDTDVHSIYLNGVLDNSTNTVVSAFSNTPPVRPARIGSDAASPVKLFFNGSIDDVRVYSRALSAAEIQRLYNIGK
jgi:hypothetical protein